MSRIQTWSLLLVLSAGSLEAWWFYNNPKPTTESPMETTTVNGTTPSAVLIKEGKEEGNLSQVGEEILKVATGIRKFVDDWDPTATAWTTSGGLTRRVEAATPNITDKTEESGVSLHQLIGDPPPDSITKVSGRVGEPAYRFTLAASSGQPARGHVPSPFYRDFTLIFNIKPSTPAASILFSITDSSQKLMYIGVKLSTVQSGHQKIQFFYTEPDSEASYEAASFNVPSLVNKWTLFALSVNDEQLRFYQECDTDPQVVRFERSPDPMDLDTGSGIFVGQAGGADPDKFEGEIAELKLVGDPQAFQHYCDYDGYPDEGSGDGGSGEADRKQKGNTVM
ncbi:hypothetical protein XENOCAPTIV_004055, partial [Xenoophorus captivus]